MKFNFTPRSQPFSKLQFLLFVLSLNAVFQLSAQENTCATSCCGHAHNNLKTRGVLAISLTKAKITPSVIRYDATGNVRIEAFMVGAPTRVTLHVGASFFDFNDTGINGDITAGDNTFTLNYPATSITSLLTVSDAFRPFLGFLEGYEGVTKTLAYNLFAQIRTAAMPNVSISALGSSSDAQATSYVFNTIGTNVNGTQIQALSQRFYQYYGDNFDFLNFLMVPGFVGNRFHFATSNAISGIGLSPLNQNSFYGSAARLKGISVFPTPSFYDPQAQGYVHELGHQWINFASGTPLAVGTPHFPMSNIASNVMGFSIGGAGGAGGNFFKTFTPQSGGYNITSFNPTSFPIFNDWELYLMGLIPKSSVTTTAIIFNNQTTAPSDGFHPNTDFSTYDINTLETTLGVRSPSSATSQKSFRGATIIVSDALLSPDEMAYYDFMTRRGEMSTSVPAADGFVKIAGTSFSMATGGRATYSTCLNSCVLPIELLSFEAKHQDKQAEISWKTAYEYGVNYFEIEKSMDAKTFSVIHNTKAQNTPSVYKAYDSDFTNAAYYRLKTHDLDGSSAYSKTIFLEKKSDKILKITQNTEGVIRIETDHKIEMVMVINTIGQVLKTSQLPVLSISDLPTGIYIILVKTDNGFDREKVFKD